MYIDPFFESERYQQYREDFIDDMQQWTLDEVDTSGFFLIPPPVPIWVEHKIRELLVAAGDTDPVATVRNAICSNGTCFEKGPIVEDVFFEQINLTCEIRYRPHLITFATPGYFGKNYVEETAEQNA